MKMYLRLTVLLIAISCKNSTSEKVIPPSIVAKKEKATIVRDTFSWEAYAIRLKPFAFSYQQTRNNIRAERQQLSTLDLKEPEILEQIQDYFTEALLNQIIPYWYQTPWDFNGHTNEPKKGEIACGYFVSTTLKHLGVVVNRYKLAQQGPLEEAQSLVVEDSLITIESENFEAAYQKMKIQLTEGLYFIGLDQNHVGYLLYRKGGLFFIHSNYLETREVCIEQAENSTVLRSFSQFYIAPLSRNVSFLKKWLRQERLSVVLK